ncbi:MAG TPA: hypothetical protein VFJ02_16305, partial [Vicinamibacterales bacterium]|nr:hypothetical protein [Vicinamibacterales bacterium]
KESGLDHDAFVRTSLRDDLKWMISQTAPSYARIVGAHSRVPSLLQRTLAAYPSQDDWLMSPLVDRYGVVLDEAPRNPAAIAMAFDGLAGAAGGRGWSLRTRPSVRSDDLRFLTWLAFSRGARSAAYGDLPSDSAFVKVVTRNPALFAELRPVPAAVAILYDPRSGAAAEESLASVYEALFRRNIAADFLHTGELSLAAMKRHRVLVVPGATAASAAAALKEFSSAGGLVIHLDERTPFDDAMVARLSKAGAVPEARVGGGDGLVETRFLQSARVLMLIALNHSTRPARVTLTFKLETQEAIWQNMETGAGVNFIAGPDGPTYTYFFRPRDALVLMIRTDIR